MNPYKLPKPYRYLFTFGKHYKIEELKLTKENVKDTYYKTLLSFYNGQPKNKKGLYKKANKNFEQFKIHVSKKFKKLPIKYCNKRRYTKFETAGRTLARCILSCDSRRTEKNRYWCDTCKAYHLTSKTYD